MLSPPPKGGLAYFCGNVLPELIYLHTLHYMQLTTSTIGFSLSSHR
jgi:hypothetical protein